MPKTPPRGTPGDDPTVAAGAALAELLEPDERIEHDVPVVAARLVLTDRRLLLVREGFAFRPRSGIRSWPLDPVLTLRLEPGRLVIEHGNPTVGVFHTQTQAAAVRALVAKVRRVTRAAFG